MLVYDLRASGVVRNCLRIADAAHGAGLSVEIWPMRPQGEFLRRIGEGIEMRPVHATASDRQRDHDSFRSTGAIARMIEDQAPRVLFSAGNQMHVHAARAFRQARPNRPVRLVGRASNALVCAGDGPALLRHAAGAVERFQYREMYRIVAVSSELGQQLREHLHFDPERISVIANGIDLAAAQAAANIPFAHKAYSRTDRPVIVGVGRLSRQKDFETLIHGFERLRRVRDAQLVIVGPGGRRRQAQLRALANSLGIGEDVWLEGYAVNPLPFISRAALFVSTSRWEGSSNVVLEALACGTPIVATRAPTGIAEVLGPGQLAPLVPIGDAAALAAAMLRRLDEPRDEERLVARAREYDLGKTMQAYAALLGEEAERASRTEALMTQSPWLANGIA